MTQMNLMHSSWLQPRWNHLRALLAAAMLLMGAGCASQSTASVAAPPGTYVNPLGVSLADPSLLLHEGTYYLYATTEPDRGFSAWTSDNLVDWTDRGMIFKKSRDSWGRRHFWAPEVIAHNGEFLLFYSAVGQAVPNRWRMDHRICVAKGPTPLGPFEDVKAPLFEVGYATIDAFPFVDGEDAYLYFARDISQYPTSDIYVIELNDDLTETIGEPKFLLSPLGEQAQLWEGGEWNEGPGVITHMTEDDRKVYLMAYSAGGFYRPEYAVGYARADHPMGPWTKAEENPILAKTNTPGGFVSGPGHGGFVRSPDGQELFYAYHVHVNPKGGGDRELALDRVTITEDDDGTVRMDIEGPTKGEPQPLPSGVHNAPTRAARPRRVRPRFSPLTRRQFLSKAGSGVALAVAAALPGCGASVDGEAIRFWNGFTGPDGRNMLRLVERFNDSAVAGSAFMQRMGWGVYYNKLFVAALGGRGPEVFVIHADQMARFARAGLLREMGDVLREGVLPPGDFDAGVLDAVTFNGIPYGVPLDVHPAGLFYNRKLLSNAGFSHPPRTRDEFMEIATTLTERSGPVPRWGFAYSWARLTAYTLCRQFGGDIVADNDPSRCTLDSQENITALTFARDLLTAEGNIPQIAPQMAFDPDTFVAFRAGEIGMVHHGIFMIGDLKKQTDLDWAAAPTPLFGERLATWASSHVMCVRPDLKGESLETSLKLIEFLSNNSVTWAEAGQVPVRRSLRATAEFEQLTAQAAFAEQIPYLAYQPQVPFVNEIGDAFDLAVDRVLRGTDSPERALSASAAEVRKAIDRYLKAGWNPTALRGGEAT